MSDLVSPVDPTAPTPNRSQTATRMEWLDCTKGLAISLVVFAHVLGGANHRHWFGEAPFWVGVYDFIYLFHMPLFFLVSGATGINRMQRKPWQELGASFRGLVWPLLVWGVFGLVADILLEKIHLRGTTRGSATQFSDLFTGRILWFLSTLFAIRLLLIPFARLPAAWLLAVSLVANVWNTCVQPFDGSRFIVADCVIQYLPFFLIGVTFSGHLQSLRPAVGPRSSGLRLLASIGLFASLAVVLLALPQSQFLRLMLGGIVGSVASMLLVLSIHSRTLWQAFVRLGMGSLAIYVLHPYFQGATRELLIRWLPLPPLIMVVVITTGATAGSLLVWELAQRYGMAWLFRLPKPQPPPAASRPSLGATS